MGSAPMTIPPSHSRHLLRDAAVLIKPEEQNCNNWTKVSIDTFVWQEGSSRVICDNHVAHHRNYRIIGPARLVILVLSNRSKRCPRLVDQVVLARTEAGRPECRTRTYDTRLSYKTT